MQLTVVVCGKIAFQKVQEYTRNHNRNYSAIDSIFLRYREKSNTMKWRGRA